MFENEYKEFKVSVPGTVRYWEDEDTGLIVKNGQRMPVNKRQFRSSTLKFSLVRNRLLVSEGECIFAFNGKMIRVTPGKNKNIISEINLTKESVVDNKPKENVNIKPKKDSEIKSVKKDKNNKPKEEKNDEYSDNVEEPSEVMN